MLSSAYWLVSIFKPVSKYTTAPSRQKQLFALLIFQRNVFYALVGRNHSPIADYKLSITGLITH
jgi:hypothetical protein